MGVYSQNFKDEELNSQVFSARRVTEHFHSKMVRCKNRGFVFSREILADEDLKKLYGKSEITFSGYNDITRTNYWRPLDAFEGGLQKGAPFAKYPRMFDRKSGFERV